jgi:hypothetical protein
MLQCRSACRGLLPAQAAMPVSLLIAAYLLRTWTKDLYVFTKIEQGLARGFDAVWYVGFGASHNGTADFPGLHCTQLQELVLVLDRE